MILTPGAIVRVALLALLAVVVEVSGLAGLRVLGGNADLIPLVVAAVALYGGSIAGASVGFAAGLLLDVTLGQHLGATSLVLTAVGYWVGRYGELRDRSHGLLPIAVGAGASAGYALGVTVVSFMLQVDSEVSLLVFRDMLVTVILNALLSLPVFWLVRIVLRPVLAVDPSARRRRRAAPQRPGPIGLRGLEI